MGAGTKICQYTPVLAVAIATRYGLDGPVIESRWGQDFPRQSRPALGPTQPPIQWIPGLSRGGKRPGRGVDHPPPSSAKVEGRVELYIVGSRSFRPGIQKPRQMENAVRDI